MFYLSRVDGYIFALYNFLNDVKVLEIAGELYVYVYVYMCECGLGIPIMPYYICAVKAAPVCASTVQEVAADVGPHLFR